MPKASQTTINVELGLASLCKHAHYGQTLSQQQIADVCGCTRGYISMLEKQAMDKLKKKAHCYPIAHYAVIHERASNSIQTPSVNHSDVLIELSA